MSLDRSAVTKLKHKPRHWFLTSELLNSQRKGFLWVPEFDHAPQVNISAEEEIMGEFAGCKDRLFLVNQGSQSSSHGGKGIRVQNSRTRRRIRLDGNETEFDGRLTGIRTILCQRSNELAPISLAMLAQVVGPTYALTAAFRTRVGRWGYNAWMYSDAYRPSSELPKVARFALVDGSDSLG